MNPNLKYYFDSIQTQLTHIDNKFSDLEKKAETVAKKAVEIKPCGNKFQYLYDAFKWKDGFGRSNDCTTIEQLDRCLEKAKIAHAAELKRLEEQHALNEPLIKHNKETVAAIKNTMILAGIPESYTTQEYPTSRSRNKKTVHHTAGYVSDIQRFISTGDGYDFAIRSCNDQMTRYETEYKKLKGNIEATERAAAEEKKKRDADRKLIELCIKYGLQSDDSDVDISDVMDEILKRNKYLRLAHFLEKNRNDWSDGPDYAECGLYGFNVETEQDQEIYDELYHHIDDWQGDGRVFRDCKWNYTEIYGLVEDEALIKDYNQAYDILIKREY